MNFSKRFSRPLSIVLVTGVLAIPLSGCQEEGRMTTDSPDLNGLWRVKMNESKAGIGLELGFTSTVIDQGSKVTMRGCVERKNEVLTRTGNILRPSPNGDIVVVNNDTLEAQGEFGKVSFQKMSVTPKFDLSSVRLMSTSIAPLSSADVCTTTVVAKMVGLSALETLTMYVPYQNSVLAVEFAKIAKFSSGDYRVGPVDSDVTVAMESPYFEAMFNQARIDLKEGTLTVTERSAAWIKGNLTAKLPNDQAVSLEFVLEMP
jgi:hypothetical protein